MSEDRRDRAFGERSLLSLREMRTHFWHYTILITIILVGGMAFFSHPDKMVKIQVGVLTVVAYIFWGIFHHLLENDLKLKIVLEYTLIGILGLTILGGVLL